MVCTRAWRRWQRWACVAVAVVVGAWLFLAAPCALLACPPQESSEIQAEQLKQERDDAQLYCDILTWVSLSRHQEVEVSPQLGKNGPYNVAYDWMRSTRTFTVNESVTYSTHTTPDMINHVEELASRWSGPVSVAVYVPKSDFCIAAARISYLRSCGHPAVRERVSWHLFWHKELSPAVDWHKAVDEDNDCSEKPLSIHGYRATRSLPYPVNVARNIARSAATTWFVLPSDVELYPSQGLAEQFLGMVQQKESKLASVWPRVYVVPVFEVATVVPINKEELIHQYFHHEAVYFHRYVCAHCQRFPSIADWVHQPGVPGTLQVFSTVKREFPFHRWEPIYICTKDEPLYDERLSWEGLQDKMTQMHELCLRGYNLAILDRAFLIHSPGIKRKKNSYEGWREPFVANNSKAYDAIMDEMHTKFGPSEKCRRH